MGFPEILEKIIEAEGCVIPDEYLRTGRRYAELRLVVLFQSMKI